MSENKKSFFSTLASFFIILGPIIDVLTSLSEKFLSLPISAGILVRFLFVGLIGIYLLFIYKDKHHVLIKVFFLAVSVYGVIHVLLNAYTFGTATLFENLKMFFKTYYFVYALLFFYALYRSENFKISDKVLTVVFLEYTGCVLLAVLTKTSFNTYPWRWQEGYCGWFFAGNEVAAVIAALSFVAIFYAAFHANIVLSIAVMLIAAFGATYVGTKVIFIAGICAISFSLVHYFFSALLKKEGACKAAVRTTVALLALVILFSANSPIKKNVITLTTDRYETGVTDRLDSSDQSSSDFSSDSAVDSSSDQTDSSDETQTDDEDNTPTTSPGKLYYIVNWLLSNRLDYTKSAFATFEDASLLGKILGIGYNFTAPNGNVVEKVIEMDVIALVINNGILGFLLFMAPIVAFAAICIKKFFKHIKHFFSMQNIFGYICSILIMIMCAALSGHIFVAPAVSVYLAIIIIKLFAALEEEAFIKTE